MMKRKLKVLMTRLMNIFFRTDMGNNVYFGYFTKFKGGGRIRLMDDVDIMPFSMLICHTNNSYIEFGKHSMIGMYGMIGCYGKIIIEDEVLMGQNVFISDTNHKYTDVKKPICRQGNVFVPKNDDSPNISIGYGSWIGRNVVIVGNVRIGKHCVIGANSVVNKNIPDYSVAVGNPCKVIKQYNFETNTWERVK